MSAMSWDQWATIVATINTVLAIAAIALTCVAVVLHGRLAEQRDIHELALRRAREDAQELALYLRLADARGVTLGYTAEAAMGRALAWCPRSDDGRHVLAGSDVCTACRYGGAP